MLVLGNLNNVLNLQKHIAHLSKDTIHLIHVSNSKIALMDSLRQD